MAWTKSQQELLQTRTRGELRFNEPMAAHTTLQVGGPADAWCRPADLEDLRAVLGVAKEQGWTWLLLGRGSNLLVRDGGVRGLVISLAALDALRLDDGAVVYAEAGVRLKRLLGFCGERGLSGLEGLEGVPGTVGGAIVMNAGTPAGVIGDVVIDVTCVEQGEKLVTRTAKQLEFAYRKTKLARSAIVVATRLAVRPSTPETVKARLAELRAKREDAQPGTQPSVGSIFRNPDGRSAWQLVDDAGLRGVRIGQARISELHANWIVNEGGATARDVERLIRVAREKVKERSGIWLEPEVVMVGEE
ncbi:MAG: UDP-N-acetylmuramate dehydrogenase [Deltaproteobacteria bacterium]|nr:UDP-N-acetylmuramate dehydrogenase [Deltaproteobacteria bacterium]